MEIRISAVRGDVTQNMKDYAQKKVEKLGKYLAHAIDDAHIQMSIEPPWCECETSLTIKNHGRLLAKSREDEMHKAIDVMVEKLERQVRDLKERLSSGRKRASQRANAIRMDEAIDSAFREGEQS